VEHADAGAQAAAAAARRDVSPDTVASIILGGGAGTRLFPLTRTRAKPAVI
jgi:glucose-1-phosphate adenylyltransferase